jgi:hypothetical protein
MTIPSVDADNLVDGSPGRRGEPVTASQAADREQAALNERLWNSEQFAHFILAVQVKSRDARSISTSMQRQLKIPDGGKD